MVDYDPRRPEVVADPYPVLAALQREDPVHRSEILGGWVLTRYADVRSALNDPRLSADRITPFLRHQAHTGTDVAELGRLAGLWAVFTDPPRHTRLRGLLNKAFTSREVERVRPRVEAIVEELLDGVESAGRMDVIGDFAYPLPVTVIAEMIGVPKEDRDRFKRWSDDVATFIGSALTTPDKYERAGRSMAGMSDYFRGMIAARRGEPREDIMSRLIAAEERGDVLSEDELTATCILLLFAGHETTTNLIGNAIVSLLRHPEQLQAWRTEPALTASAVEELLRYEGPTQVMVRIAAEDLELEGRRIRRGDRLFLMLNAANRDPAQFPEADRLDLRREPNRHIAFGYGIHFCLGAPLARLEAQIALPAVLRRLPDLEIATEAPEWLDSLVFRGVKSLPVAFRARRVA
ncbi:MAG: cytochrome P450 [Candidatus Rokuibacteriota bacterium]